MEAPADFVIGEVVQEGVAEDEKQEAAPVELNTEVLETGTASEPDAAAEIPSASS